MASPAVEAGILPLHDMEYREQLRWRRGRVAAALARLGLAEAVAEVVPSERTSGYRARVKLRGGPGGALGFHRPGSHELVEIPLDAIARPEIVEAAARLRALGGVRGECELRSDGSTVQLVAEHPVPGFGPVATRGRGPPLHPGGLRASPRSFFQVNLEVNAALTAHVDAILAELAPAGLLDLYCGIGNLSARARARGTPVVGWESAASAVEDARANLPGASIVARDALSFQAGDAFFDVAVVDPPRAGAAGLLPRLAVTRPRAMVLVSCEPTTLGRDLGSVIGRGYRCREIVPFDMFPGTEHVEVVAVLERTPV